jgi:hypothetical protein
MTLTKKKPVRHTAARRRTTGQHHTRDGHYIKAYWPYLPVFAVLLLGVIMNSWIGSMHHSVLGYATNVSSQVLLADTNGERASRHESSLQISDTLTAAAQAKANDMAQRNYWSHVSPDGKQPWAFVTAAGYQYEAAGENLAYGFGTSEQIITAWMHSPEHRANILNGDYQDVGFATANVSNYRGTGPETITVALYGTPLGAINGSTNSMASTPVVLGTQVKNVSRIQLISDSHVTQLLLAAVSGAALMFFFVRHAFAWHKVLVRSEAFVVHHPFLDIMLMSAAVFTFLLSHIAGTIL